MFTSYLIKTQEIFDRFVDQTKEIIYRKCHTALLAALIWTCGQYSPGARRVLFMFCLPKGCLLS